MLTPLAGNLWEQNDPLTVIGMALGHRMTVARLPNGSLWIHSPVAYSSDLSIELAALGPVDHLVAPNLMHDTYLADWIRAYPRASCHGARGLARARPHLRITEPLGDSPHPAWTQIFDQSMMRGMPKLNEVVFLHRASRTLIITDLAFNLGAEMPWLSRVLLKINGCYDCFAASRLLRTTIKDRKAFRTSLDKILAWDFDRIVLSHGRNVESGGKEMLRNAYAFL